MALLLEGIIINDIEEWDEKIPIAEIVPLYSKYDWPLIKVYGKDFREELIDMYQTVTKLNLWSWFENESPPQNKGYCFWYVWETDIETGEKILKKHPFIRNIAENIADNSGHSGMTFGFCMRCMHQIAKRGFNVWREDILNNKI